MGGTVGKTETVTGRGKNEVVMVHDGVRYAIDIDAELGIDEQNIKDCYIDQAGKFAWYAVVHAAAMRRADQAKMALDLARAEIDVAKARAAARLKGEMTSEKSGKPPAQNAIDAILDSQPEVVKARAEVTAAQEALTQAHYEQEVVRAVKDAFTHRRDMLIQLGADTRQEQRDRA